ncbi:hypothetical protein ASG32_17840 [Methylobacterium sp. Leaf361]|nr:hypothetical protein ASG32_17840 [Methylobacterium sp. Leaf361]
MSGIFFKNKDLNGNAITATTAVAVQMADGISNPRGQMVERIKAEGFQDQIDIQSGEFWTADNLDLHNAARYAMRVRNGFHADSGDGVIANSVLYADDPIGDTAIRQESGGGLRLVGVKTLQFNRSFVLAIADGGGTSNLMIDGSNSFENPRSSEAIKLGRIEGGTTGKVGNISIEAQVTGSIGVYPGVENVRLAPITRDTNYGIMAQVTGSIGVYPGVENVRLAPITRDTNYGIIIAGGDNISVLPGTSLLRILQQGVVIQDPATNVRVGDFLCAGCKTKVADQRVTGAGRIAIAEQRPISLPTPASSAAFVPFYEIALAPYRGLRLSVEVEGLMQNVGAVNSVADVLMIHNGTTVSAPTPVAAQKDAGAAPVELQFDTTTTPGAVRVGARVPATYSGGSLAGSITLKVDGRIASFKELP